MLTDPSSKRADVEKAYLAERNVAYVRVAVIALNSFVYYFVMDRTGTIPALANSIVVVSFVYCLAVVFFQPSRRFPVLLTSYFTSITDTGLITLWLLATGGFESPYYVLWYASIVAIAFRYNFWETVATAALYSVGYLGLLFWLGEIADHPTEIILRVAYIFFVGIMGGLLARETTMQVRSKIVMQDVAQLLEEKVRERTRSLEASAARAREANRLKSEFLATMSHELRTPLNAIIGFTEIMLGGMAGKLDEAATRLTQRVHANSRRLLALISDILDLSKIEAGRTEIIPQPFSPRALAEQLHAEMSSLADKKKLQFDLHIDPRLPSVILGDKELIEKVAANLLSNAFKFTEQGHVRFSLDMVGNSTWTIMVTDTGVGIPPHALEYIFEPFRQLDGSSQRAYGGSGLGLAITRELVRAMDGNVRVESALERGSTFVVTLPLVTTNDPLASKVTAFP